MSTDTLQSSLLNRVRVARFSKGIHDNVVITKVDPNERKNKGIPIKKMLYITYAIIDPVTKKKKTEAELAWWTLDPTSEFFFSNLREFCVQINALLACYMTDDEAFAAMEKAFEGFDSFTSVDDIEAYKWKKKDVDTLQESIANLFVTAITPFIGVSVTPIRLKVSTDSKGENLAYSSYGVFAEPMSVEPTRLKFSDTELKNHSKAGNVNAPKSASSALTSL
jgi:hypothetical protein